MTLGLTYSPHPVTQLSPATQAALHGSTYHTTMESEASTSSAVATLAVAKGGRLRRNTADCGYVTAKLENITRSTKLKGALSSVQLDIRAFAFTTHKKCLGVLLGFFVLFCALFPEFMVRVYGCPTLVQRVWCHASTFQAQPPNLVF